MRHDHVLEGTNVTLRPLTDEDVPLLAKWLFEPDVLRWLQLSEDPPKLRTEEAMRERFERMQADPFTMTWRMDTKEGRPIGQIELVNLHPLQRRAEMHMAIGEKDVWGQGYAVPAVRRLLQYAFEDLGLRRVYLTPDADNARAIRAFEKCGFVREGLLREHRLRHGQPTDMLIMGVLSRDFMESRNREAAR